MLGDECQTGEGQPRDKGGEGFLRQCLPRISLILSIRPSLNSKLFPVYRPTGLDRSFYGL